MTQSEGELYTFMASLQLHSSIVYVKLPIPIGKELAAIGANFRKSGPHFLGPQYPGKKYRIYDFFSVRSIFSSPGQSPGRAIVLPPALASASALAKSLTLKFLCDGQGAVRRVILSL